MGLMALGWFFLTASTMPDDEQVIRQAIKIEASVY